MFSGWVAAASDGQQVVLRVWVREEISSRRGPSHRAFSSAAAVSTPASPGNRGS